MKLDFCCPTLFGLEGIVADELRFEGKLTDVRAENGRVLFTGGLDTLAWANLNLRCAERVLVRLAAFRAKTFDQLFEGVRAIRWEDWVPVDGAFPVKGHALNSALHSIPDCQKIIKKAVVSRLGQAYGVSWFEETGAKFQIQFSIMNDMAEI
ncbi:MAG: class I SAM-dependent RNA methyltransferase, partial [Butyricicoccus sp.]|nr:class I SAM-dependent RNA methyltransferase [Butyricicoccus sp.]